MDAALWNNRWTDSFPDADPPPWPQENDDVESAVAASQVRLKSLQQQTKLEMFHLMCLRSHVQTMQSVGLSTPTAGSSTTLAFGGAFSERARFKRHTVSPTPVRSQSAADILDRGDIYSAPLTNTPSTRRLNRGRNLGTERQRRRRKLSRPSDVSSDDEQAQESSPSKSSLSEECIMSTSPTQSGDGGGDVVDDVTASATIATAAPLNGRGQARERLRHLRREADGDARKMILGLRRARVADGSIKPSTPTSGAAPGVAMARREFDTVMSPTEKYLPANLYPMSLTQVGDALNHSAISRLSSTESTSSDGTPICDEYNDDSDNNNDADDDAADKSRQACSDTDTDGPSPADADDSERLCSYAAGQRSAAAAPRAINRSSPVDAARPAAAAALTSHPSPAMAHRLQLSDRIVCGQSDDDDDCDADGMDVMLRAMEAADASSERAEGASEEPSSSLEPAQPAEPTQGAPLAQPEAVEPTAPETVSAPETESPPQVEPVAQPEALPSSSADASESPHFMDMLLHAAIEARQSTTFTDGLGSQSTIPADSAGCQMHAAGGSGSQSVSEAQEVTPTTTPPLTAVDCKTPSESTPSGDAQCSEDARNRHDVASPSRTAASTSSEDRRRINSISEEFSESYMRPEDEASLAAEQPSCPPAAAAVHKAMTRSATAGTVYESIDSAAPATSPPHSPSNTPSPLATEGTSSAAAAAAATSSAAAPAVVPAGKNPLYERLEDMDELLKRSISHSGLITTTATKMGHRLPSLCSISQACSVYSSGSEDNVSRDIPSVTSGEEIPSMSLEEELHELRRPSRHGQAQAQGVPPSQSLKSFQSDAASQTASAPESPPPESVRKANTAPLPTLQALESTPMAMLSSLEASLVQKKSTESDGPGSDEESLLMRKMVVMGIVDSEKLYLEVLQILINNYYKPLSAVATSSQPIISQRDCDLIFHNLCAIVEVHEVLNKVLEPLLSEWSTRTEVGTVLEDLVHQLPVYKSYLDNYPRAIDIVTRYRHESGAFSAFLKAAASIKGLKKNVPFEELLQMPVQRLQNYTLVMHDLVRYTPESHRDYRCLSAAVTELGCFLTAFNTARAAGGSETQCGRRLVKHALCVEALNDGRRKFRHLFLYEDALLCCTAPYRNRQKEKHECKWYSPLAEVSVNPACDGDDNMLSLSVSQADLNALSLKVNKYKGELKQINRAMADTRKRAKKASDREKIRKRLLDSEMHLKQMLACSLLRFGHKGNKYKHVSRYLPGTRLSAVNLPQVNLAAQQPSVTNHVPIKDSDHHHKKPYYMLFFGDLEAKEFEDAVVKSSHEGPHMELTQFELQDMMAKSKLEMDLLDREAAAQEQDEENDNVELLDGLMTLFIEGALGLKPSLLDVICIMELDTYGHFERKAKTHAQSNNGSPQFDQGFEIELEATQALVITIVEKGLKVKGRQLGKVTLDLLPYSEEGLYAVDVPIQPQGTLALRMQYFTPEETARRVEILKAHTSTSVFGQSIDIVSLRENDLVPAIVRICCEQVEKRGLEETGIYRISGLLSEVRSLKQAFDTNTVQAEVLAQEVDVHAVSGCLKLYFREMPDPVFPRAMYTKFVEGLSLPSPEARQSCLLSLLYSIPSPNLMTALHLIKHLKIVSGNSGNNKMPNQNLSTVFGPNLFKPDCHSEEEDLSAALDVVSQVGVFIFFLDMPLDTLVIESKLPAPMPQQEVPTTFVKGHRRGPSNTSTPAAFAAIGGSPSTGAASSPAHTRKFFRKT